MNKTREKKKLTEIEQAIENMPKVTKDDLWNLICAIDKILKAKDGPARPSTNKPQ
ncbi:MAG: hypothetical protein ABIH10_01005 [Spirochaetota bacterium]